MKKLFSVVLPIYNNEKNLEVTIPYIVNKSRSFKGYDVEIIMVNDGSKDRSYEIMQKLQKEKSHLRRYQVPMKRTIR